MALQRRTAEDMQDRNNESNNKLFEKGWYSLAITKQPEVKDAKSTQKYLNTVFRVCKEEGNPDQLVGAPIFNITMLPHIEDEDQFLQVLEEKEEKKGNPTDADTLKALMKKRIGMADDGCAALASAVFGYEDFSPVPRKTEDGQYLLPDGTEVKDYNERQVYYKARKAEAINKTLDVADGEIDITKYVVYGKLDVESYNGQERNVIKALKPALPDGEKLVKIG